MRSFEVVSISQIHWARVKPSTPSQKIWLCWGTVSWEFYRDQRVSTPQDVFVRPVRIIELMTTKADANLFWNTPTQ